MATPLSLRLNDDALQRLLFQARVEGIPPRTLAQRMIDEGLRMESHPLIGFMNGSTGRRAWVRGTGADVWEVIEALQAQRGDVDALVESWGQPRSAVEAAVAYYGAFPDEIDARIEANRAAYEEGRAAYLAGLQRIAG